MYLWCNKNSKAKIQLWRKRLLLISSYVTHHEWGLMMRSCDALTVIEVKATWHLSLCGLYWLWLFIPSSKKRSFSKLELSLWVKKKIILCAAVLTQPLCRSRHIREVWSGTMVEQDPPSAGWPGGCGQRSISASFSAPVANSLDVSRQPWVEWQQEQLCAAWYPHCCCTPDSSLPARLHWHIRAWYSRFRTWPCRCVVSELTS